MTSKDLTEWLTTVAADIDRDDVTDVERAKASRQADGIVAAIGLTPEAVYAFYQGACAQALSLSSTQLTDEVHLAAAKCAKRVLAAES